MSCVLLSVSLSMLAVAQALTSLMYDCVGEVTWILYQEEQTSVILSHQHDEWCMIECESIMADKGLVYMAKSIGPRTEP